MKLNSALVERTLNQFEAQAIPEDHPVAAQLIEVFGEHTFFLDGIALNDFDYIDIGALIQSSGSVPVVIKSLIFPTSPQQ